MKIDSGMVFLTYAVPADVDAIVALGRSMVTEATALDSDDFDEEALRARLALLIGSPEGCVLLARYDSDPAPVGVFVGLLGPVHIASGEVEAAELAFFTHPDARGAGVASCLVQEFEGWAYENGAASVVWGHGTGDHHAAIARLAASLGYAEAGMAYRKALPA